MSNRAALGTLLLTLGAAEAADSTAPKMTDAEMRALPVGPLEETPLTQRGKDILAQLNACLSNPTEQVHVNNYRSNDGGVETQLTVRDLTPTDKGTCVEPIALKNCQLQAKDPDVCTPEKVAKNVYVFRLIEEELEALFNSWEEKQNPEAMALWAVEQARPYRTDNPETGFSEGSMDMESGSEYAVFPSIPDREKTKVVELGKFFTLSQDGAASEMVRLPSNEWQVEGVLNGEWAHATGAFSDGSTVDWTRVQCDGGDRLELIKLKSASQEDLLSLPGWNGFQTGVQDMVRNLALSDDVLTPREAALYCAGEGDEKQEWRRHPRRSRKAN